MRSGRPEWLILPLALLPLAAAALLCLWARAAYRTQAQPFRLEGEAQTAAWLDALGDGGAALRQSFLADFLTVYDAPRAGLQDHVVLLNGVSDTRVRLPQAGRPVGFWILHPEYPHGLSATALADPQARLAVQSGRAPIELEGADAATHSFADLLRERDLEELQLARLPGPTKSFVLRRWLVDAPDDPALLESAELLRRVAPLERLVSGSTAPRPTGILELGEEIVICFGDARTRLLLPRSEDLPVDRSYTLTRPDVPDVQLVWRCADSAEDAEVVWSGIRETPLAGQWSVVLPHGDRWWEGTVFRRWSAAGAAALLLLLLAPAALLVTLRRQRRLDEVRARFINELAHDLRTPLTSLRLYAEMLAAERVEPEDRARYSNVLARESARLSAVLANLLDLSRLEGGRRPFEPEELRVAEAAEMAVKDFRALYPARIEDIEATGPDDAVVHADRAALARCLGNLLDNAGKFTPPGSPIRVGWESGASGSVRLLVSDEGPGISAAERARVFDRYARGGQAQQDGVPGTGLGLSLVRELAEGMGGSVELLAPSRDGKGSTFELRLPRAAAEGGKRA